MRKREEKKEKGSGSRRALPGSGFFGKQGVNKLMGVKIPQVIHLFTDTDKTHRNFQLTADIGNNTTLGRAVKFG